MKNNKIHKKLFYSFMLKLFYEIILILLIKINYINKNKITTALCLICKEENKYIKEYIDYYYHLRINKIILYDNNDINGENFKHILSIYIKNKFVKIINYRGFYKPQKKAYNDCYINNNKYYKWIAFYDIDEFLYIINYTNINHFLSLSKFKNCSNILINWKNYGDNNHLNYKNRLVQERFTKPFYFKKSDINKNKYLYVGAKSIVRSGLNLTWALFPHYLKNKPICRPDGTKVNSYFSNPQYTNAFIKHYATKSTKEFIKKLKRGTVCSNNNYKNYLEHKIKNYYFVFNKFSLKKKRYFEKAFNITITFSNKLA